MKRRLALVQMGVAAASVLALPRRAWAQGGYPSKPVRLVVPFPAGGATDVFARVLSTKLGEVLGASMVVENRPGAGGTIGADLVAKAAPDGYTLLLATTSTHIIGPALNPKMPYDAVRDFTPIAHAGNAPSVMLVPKNSPANSVSEWVALARSKPGQFNYASSGNGTIVQLTAELFKAMSGTYVVHIPYKGTALAIPDLMSGKVDVLFDSLPTGLPHVREGRLKALGITTLQRSPLAPDLAPVADTLPGFDSNTWFGLYGPKGLEPEIVGKVNAALNQTLAAPDVRERLARLGIEPKGGSAAQFAQMLSSDASKWGRIITERKITAD
jgi:tripartite-type tricarboxylate transporter receptor subunit TctC